MQTIDGYLKELRSALQGIDAATIQDALADAEEHLRTAQVSLRESQPDLGDARALELALEQYGTPAETAAAYAAVERRTAPGLGAKPSKPASALRGFFAVYDDPQTWGSLLYMLISLLTGVFYFSWVIIGFSFSLCVSLFIFGLPLAFLFLLSVRGLALLEGRLVEALLGERMPRRPLFTDPATKWLQRLKMLLTDRHTWLSMLYMLLQQLLGLVYFSLVVIVFALSLSFMALPILQSILNEGVLTIGNTTYFLPVWAFPLVVLVGFLLWTCFMHLGRAIGRLHRRYAKAMLVT
jgi:hypothetical protein